jgi:hyperosmotically inducible protein
MNKVLSLMIAVGFVTISPASALAESASNYIDDATITAKVKEAILKDSQLKVMQVRVYTLHGIVSLSGYVETDAQDSEAVKVATQTSGVTSVTDGLSVKTLEQ